MTPVRHDRNLRTLMMLVGVVAFMTGLAYASVPLYRLFCQVTGYGGTPQRADSAPSVVSDRVVNVTFTADVAGGLGWRFRPLQNSLDLKVGENKLAFYAAENLEDAPVTGQATFNVSPDTFGPYFTKIECFCFQSQTLAPGQKVEMPVSFFIDPAILDDPALKHINNVTLSYTFFRSAEQQDGKVGQMQTESIKAAASGEAAGETVN
ncbi:MAG: cytochrome c oxidase assembly protein [Rhodospirillaceae bacterium]|jgi:cytochrome c oxidase assembly protein subunit 11|nr:cytochrome c oxidase assembly protein [Rhodospirillaceae bacterium]